MSYSQQVNKNGNAVLKPFEAGRSYSDALKYKEIPLDLKQIEEQIETLITKTWEYCWYIGKRLIEIRDKYLKDTTFKNISDYAKNKFGIGKTTTYRFIYIATTFDKVPAMELGSKLYLLAQLEGAELHKYLEWIKTANPTNKEIEEKIKAEQPKKPGRQKQKFSLTKTKITIDLRKMNVRISTDKSKQFLTRLEELINEFADKNTEDSLNKE